MQYRIGALMGCALFLGCSSGSDSAGGALTGNEKNPPAIRGVQAPSASAYEPGANGRPVPEAKSILLATLQISPTHKVEFRQHPEDDAVSFKETLYADNDDYKDSITAKGLNRAPMADIYIAMATGKADTKVVQVLRAAEADPTKPVAVSPSTQSVLSPGSESVAVTTEADCVDDPADWDWNADATWFAQNFCPPGTQYCNANQDSPVSRLGGPSGGHPQTDSWHFNQTFCSAPTWRLTETWGCYSDPFSTYYCDRVLMNGAPWPRSVDFYGWRANHSDVSGHWPTYTVQYWGYPVGLSQHDW